MYTEEETRIYYQTKDAKTNTYQMCYLPQNDPDDRRTQSWFWDLPVL